MMRRIAAVRGQSHGTASRLDVGGNCGSALRIIGTDQELGCIFKGSDKDHLHTLTFALKIPLSFLLRLKH